MTPRVHEELSRLWKQSPKDPKVLVFGIVDTVSDLGVQLVRSKDYRR